MVEHRPTTTSKKARRRVVVSPPSLPPRWGEGVAPPTTPQFMTQYNSPETSPHGDYVVNHHHHPIAAAAAAAVPQSSAIPTLNHPPQFPASGAELLEDLHRRLQAHSVNGSLPRRPKSVYKHRHRIRSRRSAVTAAAAAGGIPVQTAAKPNLPDLLPSSAFNHPSRHTQYQVRDLVVPRFTSLGCVDGGGEAPPPPTLAIPRQQSSLPTSDYSTSPSTSESPPLPSQARTSPPATTNLPLTIPSPPIQRRRSKRPLTSTMLASPPESTSSGSYKTTSAHPTSPASPEMSSIRTVAAAAVDQTTYQNIEQERRLI